MKLHSVFLRDDCMLPHSLDPLRHAFGERWTWVQDIPSSVFDTMIRQAGWRSVCNAETPGFLARKPPTSVAEMSTTSSSLAGRRIGTDGDTVHLYYGAADSCMALATGSIRSLLAWLDANAGAAASTTV